MSRTSMDCAECGMLVEPANAYHSYLSCLLFRHMGVRDADAFLGGYGYKRTEGADRV